jgi:hypothetical protein
MVSSRRPSLQRVTPRCVWGGHLIPQEEAVRGKAVDKSADAAGMSGQLPGSCLAGGAGRRSHRCGTTQCPVPSSIRFFE